MAVVTVARAETTPQTHDEFITAARAAQDKGDHKTALTLYDKAIEMRKDSTQARYGKIISYDALGDHKNVINMADQIIKIDPTDLKGYFIRGTAYIQLQPGKTSNYKKANQDLSFVIKNEPDYDDAWINRGLSWAGQEQFDKAIADINQAIKIKETAGAYRARAVVYRAQGKEDLAQADEKKAFQLGG
jgi:tetratricopeptide (TPR) repeat protein